MELETIIGLEVHAQLSTQTKLWCSCDNDAHEKEPNSSTCPICTGFPGTLPVLNAMALEKRFRAGIALNCHINTFSKFDRKNYFYPDLPTGYQITQQDMPIAEKGNLKIKENKTIHSIGITRIHIENDAGKLTHTQEGTLCDFNRAGTPLIEIVTEPDIRSAEEAQLFAKELQKILRYTDVSNADMEKGMMRFDASISLRPKGETKLFPRTEIKNLNSFTSLKKALLFEQKRQERLWKDSTPPQKEMTVGWVEETQETKVMREKESAGDYRYFPEPDLPSVTVTHEFIEDIREKIPELPFQKYDRYCNEYHLSENDALKLTETKELYTLYESTVALSQDPEKSANIILKEVLSHSEWESSPITPQNIADTIHVIKEGTISSSAGKTIIQKLLIEGGNVADTIESLGLRQNSNTDQLKIWVKTVLENNTQSIEDLKNGKGKALQYLIGQVMKESKGTANPTLIAPMIQKHISE